MVPAFLDFDSLDWGGRGFSYALSESHLPGLIVSAILILLSVVSWSIMFSKMGMVGKASRQNYRFVYAFRQAKTPLEPHEGNISVPGSPIFYVYRAACNELAYHVLGAAQKDDSPAKMDSDENITPHQMDAVRGSMDRAIGEMTLHLESRMTGLATAVSGAPFLGLLGTVWGVMETFGGVAGGGASASLQTMAPGVAAALVTTVIALLVAIPAMFGYNFLTNKIRTLILEMNNFAAELSTHFERQFVDFGPQVMVTQEVVEVERAPAAAPAAAGYAQPSPLEDVAPPSMSAMGAAVVPAFEETTRWRPEQLAGEAFTRQASGKVEKPHDEFGVPINPIAHQMARKKK